MIKELIKLSTHLDNKGLRKEADYIDAIIKKLATADINYKNVKIASNDYYLKYRNTPKLGRLVNSLRKDGWGVELGEGFVSTTLARCLDGTDDCNRKTLVQPLTLTKGTRGDQDGTYAEMNMTYREHYYKDQG